MSGAKSGAGREWIAWVALALSLTAVVVGLVAGRLPGHRVLHPEALYPAALLDSLADDPGAWRHWNTPPAPYVFPDVVLYGVARVLVAPFGGGATSSAYGFGVLQLLLLVLGFRCLAASLGRDAGRELAASMVSAWALGVALWALGLHGGGTLLWTLTAAWHTGVVVAGVWCLVLVVRVLRDDDGRRWALLLAGLVAATTFSDRLFVAYFVAPILLVLLVLTLSRLLERSEWSARRLASVAGSCGVGALLGLVAQPAVGALGPRFGEASSIDHAAAAARLGEVLASPSQMVFVADRFFAGLGWGYRLAFVAWLVSLFWLATGRRRAWRALGVEPRAGRLVARWMLATTVVTTAASFWVTVGGVGARAGSDVLVFVHRYLTGVYVLPLVALAFVPAAFVAARPDRTLPERTLPEMTLPGRTLPDGRRRRGRTTDVWIAVGLVVALVALGVALWTVEGTVGGTGRTGRDADVRCVEREALERRATALGGQGEIPRGVARDYPARRLQVYTRGRLRVDQVTADLEPMAWIDDRRRQGPYRFVVVDGLRREVVEARLGAPDERTDCGSLEVWWWSAPFQP